jgi:hypothetical protein
MFPCFFLHLAGTSSLWVLDGFGSKTAHIEPVIRDFNGLPSEAYVMQALCTGVDATLTIDNLAQSGSKLHLPDSWSYRTRTLDDDLVVDTSDHFATVVRDELENT